MEIDGRYTFMPWNPHVKQASKEDAIRAGTTQDNIFSDDEVFKSYSPDSSNCSNFCGICCGACSCVDKVFAGIFKEEIDWMTPGGPTKDKMFKDQEEFNVLRKNGFRCGGFCCLFFGITLFFSPLIYGIKWIPLIGWLIAKIASFAIWIFAFILATTCSFITIGLAWLRYRPLMGLTFLAIAGAGIAFMMLYGGDAQNINKP
jgi:hypothetical protein